MSTDGAKTDIKALTGIRGAAALAVVVYHFYVNYPMPLLVHRVVRHGYLAVDLFFVLSGFVMALTYGSSFERGASASEVYGFLMRRIARIYPLYLVLTLATLAFSRLVDGGGQAFPYSSAQIASNLALVQAWGLAPSIVGQAWSISTEWAAYFAFPLLVPVVLVGRWRWAVLAGGIAFGLVALASWLDHHDGAFHQGQLDAWDGARLAPLVRCFGGFVLGMLVFRIWRTSSVTSWRGWTRVAVATLVAFPIGLAIGLPDLVIYPLFPILVLALAAGQGGAARLFDNPVALRLGEWSYAIYLLHLMFGGMKDWFERLAAGALPSALAGWAAAAAVLTVLVGASALTYRLIETPGRRALRGAIGWIERVSPPTRYAEQRVVAASR